MPKKSPFLDLVLERMEGIKGLRSRGLFGGYGIFQGDLMVALIFDDRLYLKADKVLEGEFETLGLQPFLYASKGRTVSMSYWEAPPEALDDPEVMREWVGKAIAAARRGALSKRKTQHTRPPGRAK